MQFTWILLLQVFLIGVSLAMDAFAASVTDGLCYRNLTKKNGAIIPFTFGVFQAVMPLIGFFIAYGLGQAFSSFFDKIDHFIAFALLFFIGGKMVVEAIKKLRSKENTVEDKTFSIVEVLIQGVATSIDALFVGVSFIATEGLGDNFGNVFFSAFIIGITTFIISLVGLMIGFKLGNVMKNKSGITEIIGGLVLIGIGLKILIEGLI